MNCIFLRFFPADRYHVNTSASPGMNTDEKTATNKTGTNEKNESNFSARTSGNHDHLLRPAGQGAEILYL